jgi:hypothetical protein
MLVGEALQLALSLHGHARDHVVALTMRTRARTERTRCRSVSPIHSSARRRALLASTAGRRRRPFPRDPPDERVFRRPGAPSGHVPTVVVVVRCAEEGGVEHGDGVEPRERKKLGLAGGLLRATGRRQSGARAWERGGRRAPAHDGEAAVGRSRVGEYADGLLRATGTRPSVVARRWTAEEELTRCC